MSSQIEKLPVSFYTRDNPVEIARDLLGKFLVTDFSGITTTGMIVETEAYSGRNDRACHANDGLRTKRTEIMYHQGGRAYVYLCYGIHHLFNVTTNQEGLADAVLVRAIEPIEGLDLMLERRNMTAPAPRLTAGPGALSQAMGISTDHYGEDLRGEHIWIEDRGLELSDDAVSAAKRVGVDYAGEDALRPWRFVIKDSLWMSKPRVE